MRVTDLMTRKVVTIARDAIVAEAVGLLADQHISAVAVVDEHERLVGVLSTTDILRAESEAKDAESRTVLFDDTRVEELMSPRPLTIAPEADAREAARQLLYGDVHRLFVEAQGDLVGVISDSDLIRALLVGAR
ncbi:MAG TPA: CBS domain-containing protein [Gemmatimonadales bacterium]|nr:CBS domain-containing protein [Gemmatimonadales bacterium]